MTRNLKRRAAGFIAFLVIGLRAFGEPNGGIVSHVSVTSKHTEDVSSLEGWKKSLIKPGVEEITGNLAKWLENHPELKGNDGKLRQFMQGGGWRKGPDLLASCPAYDDNGWLPAATHGWYATMQEYGDPKKSFLYEYGTALGYEVKL